MPHVESLTPSAVRRSIIPVMYGIAAIALIVAVIRPLASSGMGSAISAHELADLILAGQTPFPIPRWVGILGYVPAVAGALLLVAEACTGPARSVVHVTAVVLAVVPTALLVALGPWSFPAGLGPGLWAGCAGATLAAGTTVAEVFVARRATPRSGPGFDARDRGRSSRASI